MMAIPNEGAEGEGESTQPLAGPLGGFGSFEPGREYTCCAGNAGAEVEWAIGDGCAIDWKSDCIVSRRRLAANLLPF